MKSVLLIALVCIGISSFAQQKENNMMGTQHSFFAELGGPGILFSANFDTRFKKSPFGLGGRIGLGFVSGDLDNGNNSYEPRSVVTVPLQLNYLFGKPNSVNAFEVGGGVTLTGRKIDIFNYYDSNRTSVFGTASFMYRRMPKDGGFSWRAGFTPLISNGYIQPLGAVSVGYNF
jgi:hypothetical protein